MPPPEQTKATDGKLPMTPVEVSTSAGGPQMCMWECREVRTRKHGEDSRSVMTMVMLRMAGVVGGDEGTILINVPGHMQGQFKVGQMYIIGANEPGAM